MTIIIIIIIVIIVILTITFIIIFIISIWESLWPLLLLLWLFLLYISSFASISIPSIQLERYQISGMKLTIISLIFKSSKILACLILSTNTMNHHPQKQFMFLERKSHIPALLKQYSMLFSSSLIRILLRLVTCSPCLQGNVKAGTPLVYHTVAYPLLPDYTPFARLP